MQAHGVRTRRLWHEIKLIIVKTVLAMVPEIMLNYEHNFADVPGPQCFQIMGFDIIVRKDSTPILLEVNSAPSLSVQHQQLVEADSQRPAVRSIVDEVFLSTKNSNKNVGLIQLIKIPLVRDSILLVLNRLDSGYSSARNVEKVSTSSLKLYAF